MRSATSWTEEAARQESECAALRAELLAMTQQAEASAQRKEQADNDFAALQSHVTDMEGLISELENEKAQLLVDLESLQNDLEAAHGKLELHSGTMERLRQELTDAHQVNALRSNQHSSSDEKHAHQIHALTAETLRLRNEVARLISDHQLQLTQAATDKETVRILLCD